MFSFFFLFLSLRFCCFFLIRNVGYFGVVDKEEETYQGRLTAMMEDFGVGMADVLSSIVFVSFSSFFFFFSFPLPHQFLFDAPLFFGTN